MLYNFLLKKSFRCKSLNQFNEKYGVSIGEPYIENAMIYLIFREEMAWNLSELNKLYKYYDDNRFNKEFVFC
ncbi:hypothetical protein [Clostridium sp. HBUAS56017]|uniref:hypothetical protein n=1 Tax=Clostridium sp. HBUAS56017 TaxID=2571128 RepID=UPI001A9B0CD1|nr:hypothetical protein [Clostridium sp. HBUAS56017]